MKAKRTFIIFFLLTFSFVIIALISCKKVNEVIADTYVVKATLAGGDTITSNPLIEWSIDPVPPGDLEPVVRIAKVTEGETPESALLKNGIDKVLCNTFMFQYLDKPALDSNSTYAFQVSIMSKSELKQKVHYGTSGILVGHLQWQKLSLFNYVCFNSGKQTGDFFNIQFNTPGFFGAPTTVEWKIVEVKKQWTGGIGGGSIWNNPQYRLDAINNPYTSGTQTPLLLGSGTFTPVVPGLGPFQIVTNIPWDPIMCDPWNEFAYVFSLKMTGGSIETYYGINDTY